MFDRAWEWAALARFCTDASPGATLGVVSGRRRQGKSSLLEALCSATGGFYLAATEATEAESLRQLAEAVAHDEVTVGGRAATVTSGVVNDGARRRTWEVDVVVRAADGRVLALGEAKWGQVLDIDHLERLQRIRQLLTAQDRDGAERARLLCSSGAGFTAGLRAAERDGQVSWVGLDRLYAVTVPH